MTTSSTLNGIARQLVNQGLVNEETAIKAIEHCKKSKTAFLSSLVLNDSVNSKDIAHYVASDFGLPLFDLATLAPESIPKDLIKEELINSQNAVPIAQRGSRLFIAISDPTNNEPLEKYKFSSGLSVEAVVVDETALAELRSRVLDQSSDLDEGLDESFDLEVDNGDMGDLDADDSGIDETPVVRFVNKVLLDAIKKGASDIHIEPYEKIFRIRFRVDGVLEEVVHPPLAMAGRLTARIKVMSRMDISERRVPQDGRIKLKISKTKAIDFRVNTCPTLFGEKTVLRILDPSSAQLGIDALGYEPEQKKLYMDALANPYGMILVTGPTGSGKTVSLYTGLNILNEPGTNISTAEDPAEINLAGINQVNVNVKAGLTFAEALKSFLRQDPDVIMVGEIRDLETASIAVKAAQTGHLVLSTLHTNDAPQTLSRLINMGVPPFNIATAVSLIIAQRLARRLCEHCKVPDTDLPRELLLQEGFKEETVDELNIFKAVGCKKCNNGYKGRVGIYQVMKISEEISKIIMAGGNAIDIASQAKAEEIPDLRESALKKVAQGVMSLEEANRVTKD
ncbi:type IV-A pilus assembly ATPase PilB [Granulosicoccus antarcticus]|uniref:Type II secretion system protein E n=1 Tax=Granulosicoccus antarcticus IMCC3135 TaxID=1192854 RepID=A0A2Z2NWR2_9GAMM|nr:type IV-A pilus assembly ATPase PilB [Granulosicoccus antarcticus]ASJ75872.1 Type II secretion system protein E [Granulosicoccus antarcticus IMCC3135]